MCPAMVHPIKRLQSQQGNTSEGPPGQAGPRDRDGQRVWRPLLSYALNLASELHLAPSQGGKGSCGSLYSPGCSRSAVPQMD